ncbi:MAG: hypothetical protein GWO20_09045, partial [Candidatus Korarchaeota archaeon]|nr:hypothetical protein [Candidatus Korarchaeota archaeon]NIU84277.1 hypothetical protein [Candidatus Thorarchaeota archaeon]NIW13820.1 hypothetical protein [Candidatus Thorarchaeota archaeon]
RDVELALGWGVASKVFVKPSSL